MRLFIDDGSASPLAPSQRISAANVSAVSVTAFSQCLRAPSQAVAGHGTQAVSGHAGHSLVLTCCYILGIQLEACHPALHCDAESCLFAALVPQCEAFFFEVAMLSPCHDEMMPAVDGWLKANASASVTMLNTRG